MDNTSIPTASTAKKQRKKEAVGETRHGKPSAIVQHTEQSGKHEATIPLMMRPRISQKECVEQIAEQMGMKRSQLDPTFYMTGALLTGLERLGKTEQIGTWSRKEVAVYLKAALTPLFEILYEQDELPLVFSLLLARGSSLSSGSSLPPELEQQSVQEAQMVQALKTRKLQHPSESEEVEVTEPDSYLPVLSADAEIGLDGFPGGI